MITIDITLPAGRMRGDVDGDGKFTDEDKNTIASVVNEEMTRDDFDTQSWDACDVNADGIVDVYDVVKSRNLVSGSIKAGSVGPEITGNWTNNPNYATDTAQFYTDISVSGVTASDTASIEVDGSFDGIQRVECLDGAVRVYVSLCPIADVPCTLIIQESSGALNLITDRTEADVIRAQELDAKGWDAMTADEQAEWSGGMKGAYNVSDLNRVTSAMAYLTGILRGYGYAVDYQPVSITHADGTTDTTWQETDEPTYSHLERYRLNVAAVRAVLSMLPTTPDTPARIVASSVGATDGLTWSGANDIERILEDVEHLINNMAAAWYYSGDLYAGEV